MRRMDELHMNYPFAGSRMLRDMLRLEGFTVGRGHVATLMEKMGIAAIYRKRNTSKPHPAHPIYPYLLRGLTIDRPNQVWSTDITYIPMARGFVVSDQQSTPLSCSVDCGAGGIGSRAKVAAVTRPAA
jgi:putative transposase